MAITTNETNAATLHQEENSTIAYISSSTGNQEIRLVSSDGTDDRLLWSVPDGVASGDGIGLTPLSWHPDATEIAFDSGHDWTRSMYIRDIYSIGADGQSLRRLTRPPSPIQYSDYPTGTVSFTLAALEQGDVQVYIDGADDPISYNAKAGFDYEITFTDVADLGEDVRQHIRLWDPRSTDFDCNYSEEAWIDVIAGESIDAGRITFHPVVSDQQCPRMVNPTWSHDGSYLLYLNNLFFSTTNQKNDLWRISPNAPVSTYGELIHDADQHSTTNSGIFGAVLNPTQEEATQWLYWGHAALNSVIYLSNTDQPIPATPLVSCSLFIDCFALGLAWHPNGNGFFFSFYEKNVTDPTFAAGGRLYYFDISSNQISTILTLPGEQIGRISPSPEGQSIAFERSTQLSEDPDGLQWGQRLLCPCQIWTVNTDGSSLQLLIEDGHSPAWSPRAIPVSTPLPTDTPNPTPTSVAPEAQETPVFPNNVWLPFVS